jgi:hypothetical protein
MKIFRVYLAAIAMIIAAMTGFSSCEDDNKGGAFELEVSPSELAVSNAAGTHEVQITSSGAWTAEVYNSWCTVSPESGTGNATLTVSLEENAAGENRSTTIEVRAKDPNGKTISKEIAVSQSAYVPFISVDRPVVEVSYEATTVEVVVKTTLPTFYLTVPLVQGWEGPKNGSAAIKSYTKPEGAGSEWETTVKFTLEENVRSIPMEGTIVFSNYNNSISANLKLSQTAPDYAFFETGGGNQQKEALSGSWTATSNATDWCTVSASGSDGNVTITVTENTDIMPRNATVTVTSGDKGKKIRVAQKPKRTVNLSQTWTDAATGTEHTSIPSTKEFWDSGDVLVYKKHTRGDGVKVVFFNDAFNKMELAVGGVYETTTKEAADLMLAMPVLKDYQDYFDIYILMTVWEKSGLYNQFPHGGYRSPADGRADEFLGRISPMPQMQGVSLNKVTGYYYANGQCGGYMSMIGRICYAAYSFWAEPGPPGWMIHEFMGHAFTLLADMYNEPEDLSTWNRFFLKDVTSVDPISDDDIGDRGPWEGPNVWIAEWNQEAWDAFIAQPGMSGYAANLDEYRMPLPAGYREKHPTYTGGDYIWRIQRSGSPIDCMVSHPPLHTTGWDRYLVYRRIKRLAGETYSLPEFFAQDLQYTGRYTGNPDWYAFLDLHGWKHSIWYDAHASTGSPYRAWDVN